MSGTVKAAEKRTNYHLQKWVPWWEVMRGIDKWREAQGAFSHGLRLRRAATGPATTTTALRILKTAALEVGVVWGLLSPKTAVLLEMLAVLRAL